VQVQVIGAGDPVVLVHGLAGSWRWWRHIAPELAREHTVHVVDLPRRQALDPDELVDRIADRFDSIGPATYVGHSLGGLLSVRLAARHPETVSRLVLVAPAGIPGRSPAGSILPLGSALVRAGPGFFPRLVVDTLRSGPLAVMVAGVRVLSHDVRPDLAAVRAPTLLLWGERDPLIPRDHAHDFLAALPDARLELIPGAAHVPMLERPGAVSRAVLAFLRPDDGPQPPPAADASSGRRDRRPQS
jgi:pimeloyl-ACP methyl ester carboxylesterase